MNQFLKQLFQRRNEDVKLIVVDDERPENPDTYVIRPVRIIYQCVLAAIVLLLVVALFLHITPLGNLMFRSSDDELRRSVEEVSREVMALQDSLETRDRQLREFQEAVTGARDTVFQTQEIDVSEYISGTGTQGATGSYFRSSGFESASLDIDAGYIVSSSFLGDEPAFPAEVPVEGIPTRMHSPGEGHHGVDIAAEAGSAITSIANGVVINSDHTMQDGHVLYIQHGGGYVSVYKHCQSLLKQNGDIVQKGDIVATVGSSGFRSGDPHLHFELWKDGTPIDPEQYLSNIN